MGKWTLNVKLKSHEQNRGLLLTWICPQCECERDFFLYTFKTAMSFFSFTGTQPETGYEIRCSSCSYKIQINPSDSPKLEALSDTTARRKAGVISPEEYSLALDQFDLELIHDLKKMTETWKCPSCGEDNPVAFEECWSCHKAAESTEDSSRSEPQEGDTVQN